MAAILISVDGIKKLKTWLAINEESIYGLRYEAQRTGFNCWAALCLAQPMSYFFPFVLSRELVEGRRMNGKK
jgi:hypothetical protein